ncbi:MAG: AraC family transcriptional regulator, partial [Thermoanaerobaculia bacterium]
MLDHDQKLLEAAAAPARRRIRADREQASPRVKKLLNHIDEHLFDPKLDATSLMRACKVRSKSMATMFHREVGAAPMRYLRHRRMDVAVRLLTDTDLEPWKVGHLVFDADGNGFYGRFSRWSKKSPTQFRKEARKAGREAAAEPGGQALRETGLAVFLGDSDGLELDQLDRMMAHLEALRNAKVPAPPPALAIDGAIFERGIALAFWERLRQLAATEQREVVRQPGALRTTALFDVLREKSREEGRRDRQAGVRLAETALASLDGVAAYLTPAELADKQAQGWAWLGNARRLALDYPAAGRAFAKARTLLPEDPDRQVLAEISHLESQLLLFQSKLKEALAFKNLAVEEVRSLGKSELLAE